MPEESVVAPEAPEPQVSAAALNAAPLPGDAFNEAVAAEVARRMQLMAAAQAAVRPSLPQLIAVQPEPQPLPQPKLPSFFQAELDALGNLVDAGHLHPLLKGVIESLIHAVESRF